MDILERVEELVQKGLPENLYSLGSVDSDENDTVIQSSDDIERMVEELDSLRDAMKKSRLSNTKEGLKMRDEMSYWRIFLMNPQKYGRTVEQFHAALEGWQSTLVQLHGKFGR